MSVFFTKFVDQASNYLINSHANAAAEKLLIERNEEKEKNEILEEMMNPNIQKLAQEIIIEGSFRIGGFSAICIVLGTYFNAPLLAGFAGAMGAIHVYRSMHNLISSPSLTIADQKDQKIFYKTITRWFPDMNLDREHSSPREYAKDE